MTATISRLYDNYSDAQAAVQGLEAAGVPHADVSIVANNS
ncbi:MAG: general stress protein, partial [Tardiphaga sp.]